MEKFKISIFIICIFMFFNIIYAQNNNYKITDKDPEYKESEESNQNNKNKKVTNKKSQNYNDCIDHDEWLAIALTASFNRHDFFIGGTLGYPLTCNYDFLINLIFYMRPYKKTVFEELDENTYNQFKEKRFVLGINLEKKFFVFERIGIFMAGGGGYSFGGGSGYSFGNYEGSEVKADNIFLLFPYSSFAKGVSG